MCEWNYLDFNEEWEPDPQNAMPEDGAFVWGFSSEDHLVWIAYHDQREGFLWATPPGFHGATCDLVAWANIHEPPTWPDIQEFIKRGIWGAPMESLEREIEVLAYWEAAYTESAVDERPGHKPTKAELKRKEGWVKGQKKRINELQQEGATVIENGFHLPPVDQRVRGGREYAILVPEQGMTGRVQHLNSPG